MQHIKWKIANLLNQKILNQKNMQIVKLKKTLNDHVLTPLVAQDLKDKTVSVVSKTLSELPIEASEPSHETLCRWYDEFSETFDNSPFYENAGGSSFNSSLWHWMITKQLQPRYIVECGSHKGFSACLFRQANPTAKIQTFDIIHHNLVHRDPTIDYLMMDWNRSKARATNASDLVFFDDHINHAQRIIEASERGFKYLILDDNFSLNTFHCTGLPPVPTLRMMQDPRMHKLEKLEWLRNGKKKTHAVDHQQIQKALAVVESSVEIPDLGPLNRRGFQGEATFVQLK